jgi:hypothetical protein
VAGLGCSRPATPTWRHSSHLLGTGDRDGGSAQVTYGGHASYYYSGDSAAGDTSGQGLDQYEARWYVVNRHGQKIDDDSSGARCTTETPWQVRGDDPDATSTGEDQSRRAPGAGRTESASPARRDLFVVSLPIGLQCLLAYGVQLSDPGVAVHSLCRLPVLQGVRGQGAVVRSRRLPRWTLPVAGGLLMLLVAVACR